MRDPDNGCHSFSILGSSKAAAPILCAFCQKIGLRPNIHGDTYDIIALLF